MRDEGGFLLKLLTLETDALFAFFLYEPGMRSI